MELHWVQTKPKITLNYIITPQRENLVEYKNGFETYFQQNKTSRKTTELTLIQIIF